MSSTTDEEWTEMGATSVIRGKGFVVVFLVLAVLVSLASAEWLPSSDGLSSNDKLTGVTSRDIPHDDDFVEDDSTPPGNFHAFPVLTGHGLGDLHDSASSVVASVLCAAVGACVAVMM